MCFYVDLVAGKVVFFLQNLKKKGTNLVVSLSTKYVNN